MMRTIKTAPIAAILLLAAVPTAFAQEYASGQEAYDARDWDAAERLWTREAADGSAAALLGLGNILDFGLTGPSNFVGAFDRYLEAARLGSDEAAFNVGVMLDSGVGTEPDGRAAAGWYSLSAVEDFPRAQYNLGRMYAEGDVLPENPALARLWLGRAGPAVPAAQNLIPELDPVPGGGLVAPDVLQFITVTDTLEREARIAWTAAPGPDESTFRVEIRDATAARGVATGETSASAIVVALPSDPDQMVARVLMVTDTDYAASRWVDTEGTAVDIQRMGNVRFEVSSEDRKALGYAERIGASFARSGVGVTYDLTENTFETSAVLYGYDSDVTFASQVADFLPGLSAEGARRAAGENIAPEEILVRVAFEE